MEDPGSTLRDQHTQQLQSTVTPIKLNQEALGDTTNKSTSQFLHNLKIPKNDTSISIEEEFKEGVNAGGGGGTLKGITALYKKSSKESFMRRQSIEGIISANQSINSLKMSTTLVQPPHKKSHQADNIVSGAGRVES